MKEEKRISEKYNPEIDFWRLFFAVIIFLFHSHKFDATTGNSLFSRGYLATEFFFMLSGYFMTPLRKESLDQYLRKRAQNIYPPFLSAFIIAFIGRQFIIRAQGSDIVRNSLQALPEVLLLQMYGLPTYRIYNGPGWYISSMLIGMMLLWPILRRWPETFPKTGAPVLGIVGYAAVAHLSEGVSLNIADKWWGVFYIGNIRAVAGLCVGIFCRECCTQIRKTGVRTTTCGKCVFSALEFILIGMLIAIMNFSSELNLSYNFDYTAVFLLFALLLLVCSELTGLKYKVISPRFFEKMRTASLYLFLNHRIVVYWLRATQKQWSYRHYMFWYVIGTVAVMSLCWMLIKTGTYLKQKYGMWIRSFLFQ